MLAVDFTTQSIYSL